MDNAKASPFQTYAAPWNRFWFTPADPTLLALIRICCGAVTLYTIVAYSFTLQDLFGEDAWLNRALIEDFRHNKPLLNASLGWKLDDPARAPEPANDWQRVYAENYKARWNVPFVPAPYPRDDQEAKAFNDYVERWHFDPRVVFGKGNSSWSLWYHVTDPTLMAVVHGCICVIVFLFTIGLATRITSVLTWAAALWYINRSPLTLFGVDTMMTILLLYLMIGPSGAALSVDRLLARWWSQARPRMLARWRAFWQRGNTDALPPAVLLGPPEPSIGANFAIRLLQIHVCFIYMAAGLAKLLGPLWWNGNAVWWTLANFEFAPMQYESYMIPLRWLARHRMVWELVITSSGLFTLFFEISYAFLIWRPSTRWLILTMAIILHGFIGIFMGLKTFSLMMLVMNMAFLSPETVRRFLALFRRGKLAGSAEWPEAAAPKLAIAGTHAGAFRAEPDAFTGARERVKRKK